MNNLIEIAKRIIPKTFWRIIKVASPILLSNHFADFSTKYTKIVLRIIPKIILISWNSALRDNAVVKVPAPATSGNAMGTIDAAFASVVLL